jgi:hypothetical protein
VGGEAPLDQVPVILDRIAVAGEHEGGPAASVARRRPAGA